MSLQMKPYENLLNNRGWVIDRFALTAAHDVQIASIPSRATVRLEGYEATASALAFQGAFPLVFTRILYQSAGLDIALPHKDALCSSTKLIA